MIFYRLWCADKRHSGWLSSRQAVWQVAICKGLAYADPDGSNAGLGPLTWIEVGERSKAKSKTVTLDRATPRRRAAAERPYGLIIANGDPVWDWDTDMPVSFPTLAEARRHAIPGDKIARIEVDPFAPERQFVVPMSSSRAARAV